MGRFTNNAKVNEAVRAADNADNAETAEVAQAGGTDIFTEKSTQSLPEVRTERSKSGYNDSSKPSINAPRGAVSKPVPQGSRVSVRDRVIEQIHKEPTTRKTIDLPDSLNRRLQRYCADNGVKTERKLFLALLESFLEDEGY